MSAETSLVARRSDTLQGHGSTAPIAVVSTSSAGIYCIPQVSTSFTSWVPTAADCSANFATSMSVGVRPPVRLPQTISELARAEAEVVRTTAVGHQPSPARVDSCVGDCTQAVPSPLSLGSAACPQPDAASSDRGGSARGNSQSSFLSRSAQMPSPSQSQQSLVRNAGTAVSASCGVITSAAIPRRTTLLGIAGGPIAPLSTSVTSAATTIPAVPCCNAAHCGGGYGLTKSAAPSYKLAMRSEGCVDSSPLQPQLDAFRRRSVDTVVGIVPSDSAEQGTHVESNDLDGRLQPPLWSSFNTQKACPSGLSTTRPVSSLSKSCNPRTPAYVSPEFQHTAAGSCRVPGPAAGCRCSSPAAQRSSLDTSAYFPEGLLAEGQIAGFPLVQSAKSCMCSLQSPSMPSSATSQPLSTLTGQAPVGSFNCGGPRVAVASTPASTPAPPPPQLRLASPTAACPVSITRHRFRPQSPTRNPSTPAVSSTPSQPPPERGRQSPQSPLRPSSPLLNTVPPRGAQIAVGLAALAAAKVVTRNTSAAASAASISATAAKADAAKLAVTSAPAVAVTNQAPRLVQFPTTMATELSFPVHSRASSPVPSAVRSPMLVVGQTSPAPRRPKSPVTRAQRVPTQSRSMSPPRRQVWAGTSSASPDMSRTQTPMRHVRLVPPRMAPLGAPTAGLACGDGSNRLPPSMAGRFHQLETSAPGEGFAFGGDLDGARRDEASGGTAGTAAAIDAVVRSTATAWAAANGDNATGDGNSANDRKAPGRSKGAFVRSRSTNCATTKDTLRYFIQKGHQKMSI
eukprot:TRINITY_DN33358_c0_g1_i1.p1 TRINITY_DN33358_c0_g1~~TRINITY_DN33358_c0_g1_i1.p1  ORF type:complete len:795 (-),score=92.27 TRINITY_DN33358_c0_g1_i1:77-2461(-)